MILRNGPIESLKILSVVSSFGTFGSELVVIILSTELLWIFSMAFPENKPCVANAITFLAPKFLSSFTASQRVPYLIIIN